METPLKMISESEVVNTIIAKIRIVTPIR
jgi:hypothetical protein